MGVSGRMKPEEDAAFGRAPGASLNHEASQANATPTPIRVTILDTDRQSYSHHVFGHDPTTLFASRFWT